MNRKKLIVVTILMMTVVLGGCRETRLSEKQDNTVGQDNNGEQPMVYDKLSEMDFATGHIEGVLKENFKVDADIPTDTPDKMWYYEIYNKDVGESKTNEEYTEYLAELVDAYYGEDLTITASEKKAGITENIFCDGVMSIFFKAGLEALDSYMRMATVEESFPEYGQYDEGFIGPIVDEFLDKMAPVIPDGISGEYVCVNFNEEYRRYIDEKYGKDSPFEFAWSEELENYYIVRLYSKVGGYDFKIDGNFFYYPFDKNYSYDNVYRVPPGDTSAGSVGTVCCSPQYMDIFISDDGEVLGFLIDNHYKMGEAVEEKDILSPQEALKMFYKEFENVILKEEIIVTDMKLHYTMVLDEADENGYRNAYLTPVWHIFVYEKKFGTYATRICSAVDGKVLKKDNILLN